MDIALALGLSLLVGFVLGLAVGINSGIKMGIRRVMNLLNIPEGHEISSISFKKISE